jgi:RNA polymerase sigma-70 factor, ECF subfamily
VSPELSFNDLMTRLRAGDEQAACQVFQQYAGRLIALARSRLGSRLRQKVDPEDVLQSVYKSFFTRQVRGQVEAADWDGLWSLLTVITLRKCGRWVERFHTGMRRLDAEVPVGGDSATSWEAVASDPTPEEAAMLTETVERLLHGLEGRERQIVALALQGAAVAEIATEVGRTRRTVQRVLARVKELLQSDEGG